MKPEYFTQKFELGKNDCWTLVRQIFKDEHGIELPEYPMATDDNQVDIHNHFKSNVNLNKVEIAHKGCIIVFKVGKLKWHAGYAMNARQYIHRATEKTTVTDIPKNADIYEVLP